MFDDDLARGGNPPPDEPSPTWTFHFPENVKVNPGPMPGPMLDGMTVSWLYK